jgi:hypothetical protein
MDGFENWGNHDDEFDACLDCGHTDFEAYERGWDRVCTNCGLTSAYEFYDEIKIPIPYYYKHENYFQNTIISNAIAKGAPISHFQDHLMKMFHKSLGLFFRVKTVIGRDNYPNYQYALLKLCESLNVDVRPFIKLPKMKKTLESVEKDWVYIDPSKND